ncbi:Rossmann-like domain-containing protein [Atopobium sp. oral taxon 199]|uniref:Rossmann-like domain-containing protein n=1 Tax=Atopobium sp. oral taxon 199 TaxID=712156 RepID=UPI00034E427B|nr:DUF364 domain-containing protein [Atopobium sp. oral taxon 199]EPD78833.1 hypothetical protein HMPREF1527_01170 [Atopobium sp. oral taxon 199 str. F0494]
MDDECASVCNPLFYLSTLVDFFVKGAVMADWELYDRLIDEMPKDALVRSACMGAHWSYVEADCGTGVASTCRGGTRERLEDIVARPLCEIAKLSKSWDFEVASLGVAAINAWYNRRECLDYCAVKFGYSCCGKPDLQSDPFQYLPKRFKEFELQKGRHPRVVSVGRFPGDKNIAESSDYLVLERSLREGYNLPDSACEYVIPEADFVLITGMTETNKTLPRLLELASKAYTILIGPSATLAAPLFLAGVDEIAGSIVGDSERVKSFIELGNSPLRSGGMRVCVLS